MRRLVILFALLSAEAACSDLQPQPRAQRHAAAIAQQGRITDAAHVIAPEARRRISAKLEAYEQRTKHQVVVVTAPSLGGQDIAQFTRKLANAWGIGRKGFNDGVMILVAPRERKVRIGVGYGLEKTLTNARAGEVINAIMVPRFTAGDIAAGIEAGADGVISVLDDAEGRGPATRESRAEWALPLANPGPNAHP